MLETERVDFIEKNLADITAEFVRLIHEKLEPAEVVVIVASGQEGFDSLEQALAQTANGRVLALYNTAAYAVVRDMESSRPPSSSLAAWKSDVASILSLYRKHRRRIVFASLAAAQADPESFWSNVVSHFKIADDAITPPELQSFTLVLKAWQTVLADQAVSADAEAEALDLELKAAALPMELKSFNSDSAFVEISEMITSREYVESERQNLLTRLDASSSTDASSATAVKQLLTMLGSKRDLLLQHLSDIEHAFLDQIPAGAAAGDNGLEGIDKTTFTSPTNGSVPQKVAEDERALLLNQPSEMEAVLVAQRRTISEQQDSVAKAREEAEAAGRLVKSLQARLVEQEIKRASARATPAAGLLTIAPRIGEAAQALLNNSAWSMFPAMLRRRWQMRVLRASGLVDPTWYLEYHKDVANANVDPLKHYLEYGAKEGRPPNASYL